MPTRKQVDTARQESKECLSQSDRDMPAEAKHRDILERANYSERHGMKFGLFPNWVEDYGLSNKEFARLITMAQEIP